MTQESGERGRAFVKKISESFQKILSGFWFEQQKSIKDYLRLLRNIEYVVNTILCNPAIVVFSSKKVININQIFMHKYSGVCILKNIPADKWYDMKGTK